LIQNGPDISGWTGRHGLSDFLEVMGNFVDVAKIATLNAIVLPDSYPKDTLRQYEDSQ
jgi:hypothetical protein